MLFSGCGTQHAENPAPQQEDKPTWCDTTPAVLCDVPLPKPVDLQISDDPIEFASQVTDHSPLAEIPRDRIRKIVAFTPFPNFSTQTLLFVEDEREHEFGELWVQPRGGRDDLPLVKLMTRINKAEVVFVADSRGRIAVLDAQDRTGPTFVPDGNGAYRREDYASDAMRQNWMASMRSSCGGGPLSAIPEEWIDEFERVCLDD